MIFVFHLAATFIFYEFDMKTGQLIETVKCILLMTWQHLVPYISFRRSYPLNGSYSCSPFPLPFNLDNCSQILNSQHAKSQSSIKNPTLIPVFVVVLTQSPILAPSFPMATESEKSNPSILAQENPKETLDHEVSPISKPDLHEDPPSSTPTQVSSDSTIPSGTVESRKDGEDSKSTAASPAGDDGHVSSIQKKIRRAERFGISVQLTEEEKRNSRAERYTQSSFRFCLLFGLKVFHELVFVLLVQFLFGCLETGRKWK
jgi:hypothetical protein